MSPSEPEEILYEEPFQPIRVTLASGDQFVVDNRLRAMISGLSLVVGLKDDPAARTGTQLKLISIANIARAEQIDPRRPAGGRRSRP